MLGSFIPQVEATTRESPRPPDRNLRALSSTPHSHFSPPSPPGPPCPRPPAPAPSSSQMSLLWQRRRRWRQCLLIIAIDASDGVIASEGGPRATMLPSGHGTVRGGPWTRSVEPTPRRKTGKDREGEEREEGSGGGGEEGDEMRWAAGYGKVRRATPLDKFQNGVRLLVRKCSFGNPCCPLPRLCILRLRESSPRLV